MPGVLDFVWNRENVRYQSIIVDANTVRPSGIRQLRTNHTGADVSLVWTCEEAIAIVDALLAD